MDNSEYLQFLGRRPEVDEPLQLGRLRGLRYPAVAKQAPQLRILDTQARDLRLQGAELWVPAQELALHVRRLQSETLIGGKERRLLQDQGLRLLVFHGGAAACLSRVPVVGLVDHLQGGRFRLFDVVNALFLRFSLSATHFPPLRGASDSEARGFCGQTLVCKWGVLGWHLHFLLLFNYNW